MTQTETGMEMNRYMESQVIRWKNAKGHSVENNIGADNYKYIQGDV